MFLFFVECSLLFFSSLRSYTRFGKKNLGHITYWDRAKLREWSNNFKILFIWRLIVFNRSNNIFWWFFLDIVRAWFLTRIADKRPAMIKRTVSLAASLEFFTRSACISSEEHSATVLFSKKLITFFPINQQMLFASRHLLVFWVLLLFQLVVHFQIVSKLA